MQTNKEEQIEQAAAEECLKDKLLHSLSSLELLTTTDEATKERTVKLTIEKMKELTES